MIGFVCFIVIHLVEALARVTIDVIPGVFFSLCNSEPCRARVAALRKKSIQERSVCLETASASHNRCIGRKIHHVSALRLAGNHNFSIEKRSSQRRSTKTIPLETLTLTGSMRVRSLSAHDTEQQASGFPLGLHMRHSLSEATSSMMLSTRHAS